MLAGHLAELIRHARPGKSRRSALPAPLVPLGEPAAVGAAAASQTRAADPGLSSPERRQRPSRGQGLPFFLFNTSRARTHTKTRQALGERAEADKERARGTREQNKKERKDKIKEGKCD